MILRELFLADKSKDAKAVEKRYNPANDKSVVKKDDTRKTRLSLKQINELRKATEQHIIEQEKELEFVQQMYQAPEAQQAAAGAAV